jgi:hypothetical protein
MQRGQELKQPVISILRTLDRCRGKHISGHAHSPPPTGRDVSEDTQVESVLAEHSYEQVELTAILSFCYSCYFQTFWLY